MEFPIGKKLFHLVVNPGASRCPTVDLVDGGPGTGTNWYKLFPQLVISFSFITSLDFARVRDHPSKELGPVSEYAHDVTAAILVFQNNEMVAILVFQRNPSLLLIL